MLMSRKGMFSAGLLTVLSAAGLSASDARAQSIDPAFELQYSLDDLGSVPGVPAPLGGVTFLQGDPNVLLIGGQANQPAGAIYAVPLLRDCGNQITGFAGPATLFASAPRIDGGLSYGPGGVLFYTTYNTNTIGQIMPGSTAADRIVELGPLGVAGSTGTLGFVPEGFPGEGELRILSYSAGTWYRANTSPDGNGTYDITIAKGSVSILGGPEGVAFVPPGSAQIAVHTAVVSEYSLGRVVLYDLDEIGNPIVASRRVLVTGLSGAEGATIDPLTGDFLFSTFGGGNRVLVVRGFEPPLDAGDFNEDGAVDIVDLLVLLSAWGECPGDVLCPADINGDCQVDISDLLLLLNNWG